jgi:uncharacterized protein YaaN involved in tellurite resistance
MKNKPAVQVDTRTKLESFVVSKQELLDIERWAKDGIVKIEQLEKENKELRKDNEVLTNLITESMSSVNKHFAEIVKLRLKIKELESK